MPEIITIAIEWSNNLSDTYKSVEHRAMYRPWSVSRLQARRIVYVPRFRSENYAAGCAHPSDYTTVHTLQIILTDPQNTFQFPRG